MTLEVIILFPPLPDYLQNAHLTIQRYGSVLVCRYIILPNCKRCRKNEPLAPLKWKSLALFSRRVGASARRVGASAGYHQWLWHRMSEWLTLRDHPHIWGKLFCNID